MVRENKVKNFCEYRLRLLVSVRKLSFERRLGVEQTGSDLVEIVVVGY